MNDWKRKGEKTMIAFVTGGPTLPVRRVAIVTGATRGIGRAIAVELARTHNVVATWRGRQDLAESLERETGAMAVRSDISSAADRAALLEFTRGRARPPRPAGQQRWRWPRASPGHAGSGRGRLRPPHRDKPEGSALSHPEGGALDDPPGRRWPDRFHHFHLRLCRQRQSRRLLYLQGGPEYVRPLCLPPRLAPADIKVFEIRPGIIRTGHDRGGGGRVRREDRLRPAAATPHGRTVRRGPLGARIATGSSIIAPARCSTWTAVFTSARCKRSQHRKTEQTRGIVVVAGFKKEQRRKPK